MFTMAILEGYPDSVLILAANTHYNLIAEIQGL